MSDDLRDAALQYHRYPSPGKLEISPTKNMLNQRDLALAYSPGVAAACEEIVSEPGNAALYTARSNLVGVISNGTAVLGLGAIGPLASKPVMEGKAVLFKKFANVDVFDIEVDCTDVDRFVDAVAVLEPTFGGINLEDIKAPECFEIERRLRERMNIPVFHDDQHGTAICVAAAVRSGLRVAGKNIEDVRLVASGAGAAALACLNLLVSMGLKKENITVCDIVGVVYKGRTEQMDPYKGAFAIDTAARSMDEVIDGADIFLGLSAPRVLKPEQVARMADSPLIMALANPEPEILPEQVREVRDDAIIATGRSDYPNQVNNVLCFPFLFRGALDVGATEINEAMKIACVEALSDLATKEASTVVAAAYGGKPYKFGRDYLIPKPFDPRLMTDLPPRVAKAAMDSGVAARPITDFYGYCRQLREFVYRSGLVMKPVFDIAIGEPQRVIFAEGESHRVINAVQVLIDDGICKPVLVGRPDEIRKNIQQYGLRLDLGEQVEVIDPADNPDFDADWREYHQLLGRSGVSPAQARHLMRTQRVTLAATRLWRGHVDAMICGVEGAYLQHLSEVRRVIGLSNKVRDCSAVTLLITPKGTFFLTDTHISLDPSAEEIAEMTILGASVVRDFGMLPRAALLSHSNFGSRDNSLSRKMREARELLRERAPELAVEGEMHADSALLDEVRDRVFPDSRYSGAANLLVLPNIDAANIGYNLVKVIGDGLPVGPMLVGMRRPVHVLTDAVSVRGIVNMAAVAAVDAIRRRAARARSGGESDGE